MELNILPRRKTHEEFVKEVYELVGDEYEVLGLYVNNHSGIGIKHHKCGNLINVKPYNFLNGNRCKYCGQRHKRTTEEFKEEVYNLVGEDYIVVGEYEGSKIPVEMLHKDCGRTWMAIPYEFIYNGCRCGNCFRSHKLTTEEFKEKVYQLVGDEYSVLGRYTGTNKLIRMKHELCGYIYEVRPKSFIYRNNRCPYCSLNRKKTTDEFKEIVYDLVGDEYEVLGNYVNNKVKIKMLHTVCGNKVSIYPKHFVRGVRCRFCYSSKGEDRVKCVLEKYDVSFIKELKVDYNDERYGYVDFMVYDKDCKIILGIEYDGLQHFEPRDLFGGEEGFKKTQERDELKNQWFKENNIPLLRIPYWNYDNIEDILNKKLLELGLIEF